MMGRRISDRHLAMVLGGHAASLRATARRFWRDRPEWDDEELLLELGVVAYLFDVAAQLLEEAIVRGAIRDRGSRRFARSMADSDRSGRASARGQEDDLCGIHAGRLAHIRVGRTYRIPEGAVEWPAEQGRVVPPRRQQCP
jgi:hypothetical protein